MEKHRQWDRLSDKIWTHVQNQLEQWQLMHPQPTPPLLVVAVSGGSDSLCLLHVLWRLRESGGPRLHVAHLDHQFRGEQSAMEARFVAHIAAAWGIPATIRAIDVPLLVRSLRDNRQAMARNIRYAFLAWVARQQHADAVAVAHQADDQAETVLLHLLRGAGIAGLRGMRARVRWEEWANPGPMFDSSEDATRETNRPGAVLIRPLLAITRSEIATYCAIHGLTPQEDPSNVSPTYTRSRIRADLMPMLARFNPQIIPALGRTARVCADDYAYIQQQLEAIWANGLVEEYPEMLRFSLPIWKTLHPVLQRYALRRAAQYVSCTEDLSYDQIETARQATTRNGQQVLAGGLVIQVAYETMMITRQDANPPGSPIIDPAYAALPQLTGDTLQLIVPGHTPFSAHWSIACYEQQPDDIPAPDHRPDGQGNTAWIWSVALDADALGIPQMNLFVRRRRAGDSFRPAGGLGTKRIQDFFVDRKIPRALRENWPLLATPDQIVWVVGLRADERFVRTSSTTRPLWVVFRRNSL